MYITTDIWYHTISLSLATELLVHVIESEDYMHSI